MEIKIPTNLLSLERVICLLRKRRYKIKSLTVEMNDTNSILNIEFEDADNKITANRKKQIEKLIELM